MASLSAVHPRRLESADRGDPSHVRSSHTDPTLPGPQGAQYRRAAAQASARLSTCGAAPGLELDDADKAERLIRQQRPRCLFQQRAGHPRELIPANLSNDRYRPSLCENVVP